ncbi:MAG: NUDIX hydrolase [Elusimicrobia bacterium]|nr:NUDIX hydrolase [Elusimicrobiota bacterium]
MTQNFVETCVKKREVHRGRSVNFRVDQVRLPNGNVAGREFLDHPGAVGVVPILPGGKILMVKQFRYPVGEVTYELPAGKLDHGENPLACVRRELKEETGYVAGSIKPLIRYWPTPAFANELLHLYVARKLKPGSMNPDDDEFVAPEAVPLAKALRWILSGRIKDSKTVIGILACREKGIL